MVIKPTVVLNPCQVRYRPKIPAGFTVLVDSREQTPYELAGIPQVIKKLDYADYSVKGLENEVSIERKSLPDLYGSVGKERERDFSECWRECSRLSLEDW